MSRAATASPGRNANLEELKGRVDLVEIVRSSGVALTRRGKNWLGRCPYHDDETASLSVNSESQLFNCFGCQTGGDVLRWIQLREKVEFPAALERLQHYAGESPAPRQLRPVRDQTERLAGGYARAELLERVVQHYGDTFRKTDPGRIYLEHRGLTDPDLAETFRLGYCDGSLVDVVPAQGELRQALTELGVLTEKGSELLRGCLVVPLTHPDRGVVGLYGRKVSEAAQVAHLYLSGPRQGCLNWQALQTSPEVWLTESVLDALSLWQAGCRDVTCLFGVQGLPSDLEALLGRYAVAEVRLCLDADRAGHEATVRLGERLRERGIRCRQVSLPEGTDPNQLLCERGPAYLAERALAHEPLAPNTPAPADAPEEAGESREPESSAQVETSPEGYSWRVGELAYRVTPRQPRDGKLQVLLEAERGPRRFRDTLNLDSYRQRALAGAQIATRLEISRGLVDTHFLRLIDETQSWYAAREEPAAPVEDPTAMTEAERDEALAFLHRDDLVNAILQDSLALGYVGEERSKLLTYLIGISRKMARPLSGSIKSQSGAGKSTLTEMVELLTPREDVVLFSKLTPQALYWMSSTHLKHKLLMLEERVGAEAADYSIRVLQSRQVLTMAAPVKHPTTGRMETQTFVVEGPIAYLETTTSARLNYENATRCFELTLDESEEQTARIHQRQRQTRSYAGLVQADGKEELVRRHHCAQRLLEPIGVVIPFVDRLRFPARWLRTRRDHERFLSLIEVVAFLHQHQRPRGTLPNGTPYIEATPADYRLAFHLCREVLAATFHELSRDGRELLELLGQLLAPQPDLGSVLFTRRDLRSSTNWQDHRLRNTLEELAELEYVELVSGSKGKTCQYRMVAPFEAPSALVARRDLTTPEELEREWPVS